MKIRELCTERGAYMLAGQLDAYWKSKGKLYEFTVVNLGGPKDHTVFGIRSNLRFDGARQLPPVTHAEAAE